MISTHLKPTAARRQFRFNAGEFDGLPSKRAAEVCRSFGLGYGIGAAVCLKPVGGLVQASELYVTAGERLGFDWIDAKLVQVLGMDDGREAEAFIEAVTAGAGACLALLAEEIHELDGQYEAVLDAILDAAEQRRCPYHAAVGQFLAVGAVRLTKRLRGRIDLADVEAVVRDMARFAFDHARWWRAA